MRPARLAESTQQNFVGGLEENDPRRDHLAHGLHDRRELAEFRTFANVDDQSRAADFARLQREVGETWNQFERKVVNAVVAEIFECLEYRGFSGATHASDDDELGRALAGTGGGAPFFLALAEADLKLCGASSTR